MNNRIQKLAEQAEVQVRLECNNAYWRMATELPEDGVWQEKFAELIIRECIDYCGENLSKTVGGALKIHFGVE